MDRERRNLLKALACLPIGATVVRQNVQPDDVIVIECQDDLCDEAVRNIEQQLALVWPNRKVFVLHGGLTMKIARSGQQI